MGNITGGVFYSGNLNPYIYTYQNPIIYIDPNGKQTISPALGYGSGGAKMEDLQKAGETINRFFTGVGNFVRDAASSMYQTAKVSWAASIGDKQGIQSGVNQMITESQEQAHYIASGDIVDDLQTPEGMGYAATAIATVYVTKKIKLGGASFTNKVLK